MNNKLSETASIVISHCWKNSQPVSIVPQFDTKFEYKNKKYTFTKEVLKEIEQTGLVRIHGKTKISVVLTGIGEQPTKKSEVNNS